MENTDFKYRRQGRQLPVYLGLWFGLGLLYLEMQLDLPVWGQVLIWAFLGAMVWQLALNRSSELRITAGWLELYRNGEQSGRFALNQLDRVQIRKRPFGGADAVLLLVDGRQVYIPANAMPPVRRLRAVLALRGVPIV